MIQGKHSLVIQLTVAVLSFIYCREATKQFSRLCKWSQHSKPYCDV